MRRTCASILSALLLISCSGDGDEQTDFSYVRSARSGLLTSMLFVETAGASDGAPAGPPALSSLEVSVAMSDAELTTTTPGDVDDDVRETVSPQHRSIEDQTKFIEEVINLLVTDIQTALNQSSDRADTLNDYLGDLRSNVEDGKIRLRNLEAEQDRLEGEERRLGRRTNDLEKELDEAIRAGESSNASSLLTELMENQKSLVQTKTDLSITERFVDSLSEVLEPLANRQLAIEANRQALIKGVHVTDIPGVEDLGILRRDDGRFLLRGSGRRSSIFRD